MNRSPVGTAFRGPAGSADNVAGNDLHIVEAFAGESPHGFESGAYPWNGTDGVVVYCPTCGSKIVDSSRFCPACGIAIEPKPRTAQGPPAVPAPFDEYVPSDEPSVAPVDGDGGASSFRVWLIGAVAAVVVVVLVLVGLAFVSDRDSSNPVSGAGGTLPVASPQDQSGTSDGAPDVTKQGTVPVTITVAGAQDEAKPGTVSTTTTTTLIANSVPVVDPESLQWSRVSDNEAVFGGPDWQRMESVVAAGPGLVAVGWDGSGDDMDAAVWWSVEGLTWNRLPDDAGVFGGPNGQRIESVVAAGPGLVAVGSDRASGVGEAAVWWSVDGLTWNRVSNENGAFGSLNGERMQSVTAVDPGIVAVGTVGAVGGADAAVWWSVDGLTWDRVPGDEAVFGGTGNQSMQSVVAAGPGLVAVGSDGQGQEVDAAVWWSTDGLTWDRVPDDEAVFGGIGNQWMQSVVAAGSGLVAVGLDGALGDADAAVWWSVDGLTWNRVAEDEAVFGGLGHQSMQSAIAVGSGLVAVGYDPSGGDYNAGVWWSGDGVTWGRVPPEKTPLDAPGDQFINAVIVAGDGLVAVGSDGQGQEGDAAVWVAEPSAAESRSSTGSPWLITPTSIGPVTLGAPVTDLEDLTSMQWDFAEPAAPGCVVGSLVGRGVSIQGYETVSHIAVTERGVARTQEGVQVGDHELFVLDVFGDRATAERNDYSEPIIVVDGPTSGEYSYILYLNNDGFVVAIHIVDGPGLIEHGCA